MLSKLISLLIAGKGGAVVAAALVAGATTVGAMTSSADVQDTLRSTVAAVSLFAPGTSQSIDKDEDEDNAECEHGQPVVVAERNAADKQLRSAFQEQHKRLEQLRGGKDGDHEKANVIVHEADRGLRGVLTKALDDVAALTLGREGRDEDADEDREESPSTSPTPTASPTAEPICTPAPETTPSTTLTAALQSIVDTAAADMKAIADTAAADLAALPPAEHGKSGDHKPSASPGTADDEHGKARLSPRH